MLSYREENKNTETHKCYTNNFSSFTYIPDIHLCDLDGTALTFVPLTIYYKYALAYSMCSGGRLSLLGMTL